jgi:hypothetical protein
LFCINHFKNRSVAKDEVKLVVLQSDNALEFKYPIEINFMCLLCDETEIKLIFLNKKNIFLKELANFKQTY